MIEDVRYYPENRDTPAEGFKEIDIDNQGNTTYIKVIDRSGVYNIIPDANKMAMREAVIYVDSNNVPYEDGPMEENIEEENMSYELENAVVKIVGDRIISNPKIIETIGETVNETQMTINELSNKISDVHEQYVLNKMDIDFTTVLTAINTAITEINQNITNNYNNVLNIYETNISNVKINNEFKETINVELQQITNQITNITVESIKNCLNIVSNNQNILVSDISKIKDFMIEMYGQVGTKVANNRYELAHKTPCKKLKTNINNALTNEPEKDDINLIDLSDSNDNNENVNVDQNNGGVRLLKRFRGINDQDVAKPVRQTYYWNDMITVDQMNEKYDKDYYGMFKAQYITEVPMLDVVNINITENNPSFVWDIYDNYINTNDNEVSGSEDGYNPIGVRRFNINVDVPLNNKLVNYFEKLNPNQIGYINYDIVTINPTPLKEDIEANYVGDKGVTLYDSNEKIYVNNHKYTIQQENEELGENFDGFNSVIQTSIVPIMDSITLPEVKTNGTVTYKISDFNSSYMMPNSSNIFRNDFIGVDTINIPVNVNRLVIPLNASTAGVYHPTDYNPNAIGFSVVEVVGNNSSGGSSSVNNLLDYTFTSNSNVDPNTGDLIPYTIQEYNNAQDPVTNYTGFNNIKVNVPVSSVDNADVDSANNNVITSRSGTYLIPSGKTGWNSFRVEVPTDVNNYNPYPIGSPLNITTTGSGSIVIPNNNNYTGLDSIYYNLENGNVNIGNNNIITSRTGTYTVPVGKVGWNSFEVNVPSDINNYIGYDSLNPLSITSSSGIINVPNGSTGFGNINYEVENANVDINNNNIITSRNGTYTVPNGKVGWNSFEVNVPSDVNNYNGYTSNNKLVLNNNTTGILSIPQGYTGFGEINYEIGESNIVGNPNIYYKITGNSSSGSNIGEVTSGYTLYEELDNIGIDCNNRSNCRYAFYKVTGSNPNVTIVKNVTNVINYSNLTDLYRMFSDNRYLKSVSYFDTSNITDFSYMFNGCYLLENIPNFNFSSGTTFGYMFSGCYSLKNIPVFSFGISKPTVNSMFASCFSLENITINLTNVETTTDMFFQCVSLRNVNIIADVDSNSYTLRILKNMFSACYRLIDAPNINTKNTTNMQSMFSACYSLKNVPVYNTSNVISMDYMFSSCVSLTNNSLNNILKMCIDSNVTQTESKYFNVVVWNVNNKYDSILPTLSNYNDFIAAGWNINRPTN